MTKRNCAPSFPSFFMDSRKLRDLFGCTGHRHLYEMTRDMAKEEQDVDSGLAEVLADGCDCKYHHKKKRRLWVSFVNGIIREASSSFLPSFFLSTTMNAFVDALDTFFIASWIIFPLKLSWFVFAFTFYVIVINTGIYAQKKQWSDFWRCVLAILVAIWFVYYKLTNGNKDSSLQKAGATPLRKEINTCYNYNNDYDPEYDLGYFLTRDSRSHLGDWVYFWADRTSKENYRSCVFLCHLNRLNGVYATFNYAAYLCAVSVSDLEDRPASDACPLEESVNGTEPFDWFEYCKPSPPPPTCREQCSLSA